MEEYVDIACSLYQSIPAEQSLSVLAQAEIEYNGYALLAIKSPKSERVLGLTLGLAEYGHPELMSTAGSERDVLAFLNHLASQVTEHQRVFSIGANCTALFRNLRFHEPPAGNPLAGIIDSFADIDAAQWLFCRPPASFKKLRTQSRNQRQWNAA